MSEENPRPRKLDRVSDEVWTRYWEQEKPADMSEEAWKQFENLQKMLAPGWNATKEDGSTSPNIYDLTRR